MTLKNDFNAPHRLRLFQKAGFEYHDRALHFALYLFFVVGQADVFDFGAAFDDGGRTPHFQVLDNGDGIPFGKQVAVGIFYFHDNILKSVE